MAHFWAKADTAWQTNHITSFCHMNYFRCNAAADKSGWKINITNLKICTGDSCTGDMRCTHHCKAVGQMGCTSSMSSCTKLKLVENKQMQLLVSWQFWHFCVLTPWWVKENIFFIIMQFRLSVFNLKIILISVSPCIGSKCSHTILYCLRIRFSVDFMQYKYSIIHLKYTDLKKDLNL